MRLIDADVVKQNILEVIKKQGGTSKDLIPVRELPLFIDIQPTAYSVDKVVEELETDSSVKLYGSGNSDNYLIPVKRAIEIVKQGGVSDDVCEYENTNDEYCKWKINSVFPETINNPHVAERENIATTKYCPYCGKKIKIVGD